MKRIISALALVTVTAVGIAGCSGDDDDDTAKPTAGRSSTGGEPATNGGTPGTNGGEPATNGGTPGTNGGEPATNGGASGNVMCDPTADGVCQNEMDCPFVVDGTARIEAGKCGQGCLSSGDENCSRDCILDMLDMSSGCAQCYADTVACTIKNCLGACINDPEAAACKECQVEKGCRAAFNECSGLPE
jgi:hypothetical protein